jgi:hypothetical protein
MAGTTSNFRNLRTNFWSHQIHVVDSNKASRLLKIKMQRPLARCFASKLGFIEFVQINGPHPAASFHPTIELKKSSQNALASDF